MISFATTLHNSRTRAGMTAVLVALSLMAATWFGETNAWACATCGCGDPTLTAMGAEKPYAGRLRVSLDGRARTDSLGEPSVDRVRLREYRADLQAALAPSSRLFVMTTLPVLHRTVTYESGATTRTTGLGDAEVRVKAFIFQDADTMPRHLVALTAGMKVPTAPLQTGDDGERLPPEVQPGTSSWDPLLGVSYAFFPRPWSFYASAQGMLTTGSKASFRSSPNLRTTTVIQRQFGTAIAMRTGLELRFDGKAYEDGAVERDSGGVMGFVPLELLLSPVSDLLVVLSARVPAIRALDGFHEEGPIWGLTVAHDFSL